MLIIKKVIKKNNPFFSKFTPLFILFNEPQGNLKAIGTIIEVLIVKKLQHFFLKKDILKKLTLFFTLCSDP